MSRLHSARKLDVVVLSFWESTYYVGLNLVSQAVVSETHDFYRVEADACMRSLDVPAYLAHVQRRLDEENERIIHYLDSSTRKV